MTDSDYMELAIALAQKGCGYTAPNPMVGAIIVKNQHIIGVGYHERYGEAHAERNALNACTESPKDATIYVTLEPCCHQGKQPPCVDAIIDAGIKRVVVGCLDPNPLVAGKGCRILREHGIEVVEHVKEDACKKINEVFFHYITEKKPFVAMKYAMTLDGKIATRTGASKWITGEDARMHVQKMRHKYSAIMVGIGTVLADDPLLTCRIPGGKNPLRIICDTNLKTPLTSQIVQTANEVPTIIATCCCETKKWSDYTKYGCRILQISEKNGHLDLNELMEKLGKEGIDSILLEGGGTLNYAALESNIVQKILAYIAPKLFGGSNAKSPVEGLGITLPSECVQIINQQVHFIESDILIEGDVIPCSQA